jgi:hypothetical protein
MIGLKTYYLILPKMQKQLKVLESFRSTYTPMTLNKSSKNQVYRNAIFSAIVSFTNGASQNFIPKALRATRYSLRKALIRKVHVDETNENIWVGLP